MAKYPEELLDWAGDRAGGVKKLFYSGSGRPAGKVVTTALLERLHRWAVNVGDGHATTPTVVLLVGGPGNGKTEAVEHTIRELDTALGLSNSLIDELAAAFNDVSGTPLKRLVSASHFSPRAGVREVAIVQDASESEPGLAATPAKLFVEDMTRLLTGVDGLIYLACVNRGILDDALIFATESGREETASLLKKIIQAVSLGVDAPSCWPLSNFPRFAVWPMDVESLTEEGTGVESAARQVVRLATDQHDWPDRAACPAGERCPFCANRELLSAEPHQTSLVTILRWYELASGKRWNFRDLYSLIAFLLAGTPEGAKSYSPCEWAASTLAPRLNDPLKLEIQRKRGLFKVLARQYQHALFGRWPTSRARALRSDLAELKLTDNPTLAGLQAFLALDSRSKTTLTLDAQLQGLVELLDPARASPGLDVALSGNTIVHFDELDRRFSLSIREGRRFLARYQCLSPLELEVLKSLEDADQKLSDEPIRRHKPAVAARVQAFIRSLACQIARRSVGVRSAVTRDSDTLKDFHRVTLGDNRTLQEATQQVEGLLNANRRFVVSLNTTFGEPLPPLERRAMLTTDVQRVRELPPRNNEGRPASPVRFLRVGGAELGQPVALTYELFKATKALRNGMIPASLPRSVVALLDTTRARLAGAIVRSEDALDNSEISIGIRDDLIVNTPAGFVIGRREPT